MNEDDTITYQYVLPKKQRLKIMEMCHDSAYSGHFGVEKTMSRVCERFYWPYQSTDIEEYVKTCIKCQLIKKPTTLNTAELMPILPTRPFELVTSDIMGPIKPISKNGNKYILVICDHFTKWIEVVPLKRITAEEVAKCLVDYFCRYGICESLLSDQGRQYESALIGEMCDLLDIGKMRTAPERPQCDGLSERTNRSIKQMIKAFVNSKHNDWDEKLAMLAFAYNTASHSTTKLSPYELVFGRKPRVIYFIIYINMLV